MIWETPWPRYFIFLDFFSRFCSLEHSSWVSGVGWAYRSLGWGSQSGFQAHKSSLGSKASLPPFTSLPLSMVPFLHSTGSFSGNKYRVGGVPGGNL